QPARKQLRTCVWSVRPTTPERGGDLVYGLCCVPPGRGRFSCHCPPSRRDGTCLDRPVHPTAAGPGPGRQARTRRTPGVCVSRGFSADGCESSRLGLLLVPLLILGPHQGVVGDGHQQKVDLVIQRLEGAGSPTQPQEVLHSLEVRLGVL